MVLLIGMGFGFGFGLALALVLGLGDVLEKEKKMKPALFYTHHLGEGGVTSFSFFFLLQFSVVRDRFRS